MKKLLLASAAAFAMGGMAYAAEPLAPIAPPLPPMVEPFFVPTWAGPYIGADIGWGWADIDNNHHGFFGHDHFGHDRRHFGFDSDLDGLVGGVFAGWLGQRGTFLYGVELFAQLADIDNGGHRDAFHGFHRRTFQGGHCLAAEFVGDPLVHVDCPHDSVKVHALFGLEGMIGWGGDRTAFLLHAGPALGWFQSQNHHSGHWGFRSDRGNETEFGLSVAAEGRFKLTERIFAGVIGRAFWFPDVEVASQHHHHSFDTDGITVLSAPHHTHKDDVTVFEVKARLGVMFGQPPAAAPVQAAF